MGRLAQCQRLCFGRENSTEGPACEENSGKIDEIDLPSSGLKPFMPKGDHTGNRHREERDPRARYDPPSQQGHPAYHEGRKPFVPGRCQDEGEMVLTLHLRFSIPKYVAEGCEYLHQQMGRPRQLLKAQG